MEDKYLAIKKEGLFQKIKSFFANLFHKNEVVEQPVVEKVLSNNADNHKAFTEKIRITPNDEKLSTLKLQRDYEAGLIKEEEMTEEQVQKVENLYIEQITKLRKDKNNYKQKIKNIQKKLASNKA